MGKQKLICVRTYQPFYAEVTGGKLRLQDLVTDVNLCKVTKISCNGVEIYMASTMEQNHCS